MSKECSRLAWKDVVYDDDAVKILAAAPTTGICCGACRRACRRSGTSGDDAGSSGDDASGAGSRDSGEKKLPRCYIRLNVAVVAIHEVEHSFRVRGWLDLFWEEKDFAARFKKTSPGIEVPTVACYGDKQLAVTLPDDGASMPLNPRTPFANQLEFSETAHPKLLFDEKSGVVHYSIPFDATLAAWFDLHNFPFDRQVLPITFKLRSEFMLSPEPFEHVPDKRGLRTPVRVALESVTADQYRLSLDLKDRLCILYGPTDQ
eukprot:COSAG01_NODE_20145_length_967_cov_1.467204_1_plen_259_part_01